MNKLYVKCDSCGERIELRNITGLDDAPLLIQEARDYGWTGDMTVDSTNDKCPACSAKPQVAQLEW